LVRAPP